MRVVEVEDRITAAGAQIVWVLQADVGGTPGTVDSCVDFMEEAGSELGWCVGDDETEPRAGTFDDSPFAQGRGYDFAIHRDTMSIDFVTDHGTPSGNENLEAEEIAAAIEAL